MIYIMSSLSNFFFPILLLEKINGRTKGEIVENLKTNIRMSKVKNKSMKTKFENCCILHLSNISASLNSVYMWLSNVGEDPK